MARRRKDDTAKKAADPVPRKILKHVEALGFSSFEEYQRWCRASEFPDRTDKDWSALQLERETRSAEVEAQTKIRRLTGQPRRAFELVCKGELTAAEITSPRLKPVCEQIERSSKSSKARASLLDLFLTVERKADFLLDTVKFGNQSYHLATGLIRLNDRRGQWIRSLGDWSVKSHNARKQFASLLRHLLVRYDAPSFMDSVWLRDDEGSHRMRDWYFSIGNGGSLRKEVTPIPLTKKMMHHFMQAPNDYSVENAFRWGQVHALGGNARLCDAIVATRLGGSFDNEDFWRTVIRFLARSSMLDCVHVGPIVDYLQHHRFETQVVFTAPGVREEQPPLQPNLSMRGRRVESLLRRVEGWHEQLGRVRKVEGMRWESSGIAPFEFQTGTKGESLRVWRIRELLSSGELREEGRAMHHCVATYALSCSIGASSIWTLEVEGFESFEKLQTIDVNRHKVIVESRGRYNSRPNQQQLKILRRWAQEAGLEISRYVVEG